jgi:hypothetical protein
MKSGHVGIFERTGIFHKVSKNPKFTRFNTKTRGNQVKTEIIRQLHSTYIPNMIETMLGRDPELRSRIQLISERKLNQKINELLLQASK